MTVFISQNNFFQATGTINASDGGTSPPPAVAPEITTQPTDQSVTVGETATFTVAATGTPTPTYQWRFEGSDIAGATSASYTLSSAALTDAGDYTVVVTNTAGTVTSTAATLTAAVDSPVVLAVEVTAGTATLGVDLGTDLPTTVTIDANTTEATFIDDDIAEGAETFTVTLDEDPANPLPDDVSIGDGVATGTITDNDEEPGTTTGIRISAGPRLTWGFDGGQVAGGARVQWDFLQLEDGTGGRISGAADIGVTLDLAPRVTLGVQGDVDGIGVSDEFGSLGGKVEIKARF